VGVRISLGAWESPLTRAFLIARGLTAKTAVARPGARAPPPAVGGGYALALTRARRKAIAAFLSALSEEDRRHLTSGRTDHGEG
jgi:hypothetical protein